ncbi:hypothetical protein [Streptomyces sp. NBC_00347]|uniref:hypothetical protein n=1 Tax=Streptomyces sp. NBC_00347 TaxID=2975721 RepID=UPI00224E24C0|nr:hypothetical protein [Streptomyces sp. NBC_00347]MCX5129676.1 hypothetical protein [Streptomyces sp. NBC_00347]
MSGRRRLDWLGLTPEPERELPAAVAALRASSHHPPTGPAHTAGPTEPAPPADLVVSERRRLEHLVLRGTRRDWLRYLAEVTALVTTAAGGPGQGDRTAALIAGEVVLDHHRMLIGLPGTGYARTAADRTALESAVRTLRATPRTGSSR